MANKYENIRIDTNSNEKHGPGTSKQTYTAINSPLYTPTTNGDKIVYSTDINWKDIILSKDNISTPIQDTATLLDFIATRFNAMNNDITNLLSRVEALENNKQATVVSAEIIKQDNIYDGIILYIGESIKFPKPTVKLTFSDDSVEYITVNDNNLTWEITNLSLLGATFKEGSEYDDGQFGEHTPIDETGTSEVVSSINYHNYIKCNREGGNNFFGEGETGANIFNDYSSKNSRHPLSYLDSGNIDDTEAIGTYPYRILDKFCHGFGQCGTSSPEFIYTFETIDKSSTNALININTNINNDFEINVNSAMSYSYLASFEVNTKYHDVSTNTDITTNKLYYNNILFAPKKNITIHILNKQYNLPLKAACHVDGNKTLSGQYDITKFTDNNQYLSEIANSSYFDIEDRNHNKHVIYGFTTTSQEGNPKTLSYIFTHQELPIDYIKLPDDMWYKKSYIGDNTNWQNRSNSYYAYFDNEIYHNGIDGNNITDIYAYIGNRLTFNYPFGVVFDNMPQYSYAYVKNTEKYILPTKTGYAWYTDSSYTNKIESTYYEPTNNITLYAKFEEEIPQPEEYFSIGTEEVTSSNYRTVNNATTTIPTTTTYSSTQRNYHYILIPSNKTITIVDDSDNAPINFTEQTSISIPNHKVYKTNGPLNVGGTVRITLS